MTLDSLIMLTGALVALLPFLGFPESWDMVIFFLLGVLVIGLGIAVRRHGRTPSIDSSTRIEHAQAEE